MEFSFWVFLVIIFGPLNVRANSVNGHYPDMTCYKSYEKEGMDNHEKACRKKSRNPLSRGCYKACMLERLKIITVPDIYNLSRMEYQFISSKDEDTLKELKAVFFDDTDMQEVVRKIEVRCVETMNQLMNVENLKCEDWGPAYDCIQNAVCYEEVAYPDMSCHYDYRSYPFRHEKRLCQKMTAQSTSNTCMKGCILQNLGIYVYDLDTDNPVPRMGNLDDEDNHYNMLFNIIDGLSGNKELAEALLRNTNTRCNETFNRLVVDEQRHCSEWTELYDCVEKELGCYEVTGEKLKAGRRRRRWAKLKQDYYRKN